MKLKSIFKKIKIKSGDKIIVTANIIKILSKFKKKEINFDPNIFLNELKRYVGKNGTIFIPTYNWDFCNGKTFHYKKTRSQSGSLGNIALKRKDFTRSYNPIYSMAISGKDMKKICNQKHTDCFSLNSPFGYLLKNKGKNIFIDTRPRWKGETKLTGFIFHHIVEQAVGVADRYFKKFSGKYINKKKIKKNINIKFYVKDLSFKYKVYISKKIEQTLRKKKLIKQTSIKGVNINIINLYETYKILKTDLKTKNQYFLKKH